MGADRNQWQFPKNVADNLLGWRDDGKGMENKDSDFISRFVGRYETEEVFENARIPAVLQYVETAGYHSAGDGGGHLKIRIATPSPAEAWHKQSADGAWWQIAESTVSPKMLGAVMNGVADDKLVITSFIDCCASLGVKGHIPRKTAGIGAGGVSVTLAGDLDIRCDGEFLNLAGAAQTSILIEIDGSALAHSVKWRGGTLTGASTPKTLLRVFDCDVADIAIDEASGIVCDTNSNSVTSAVLVQGCNRIIGRPGDFHDLDEGTSLQGSIPRCFSFNTCPSVDIYGGNFYDAHGGFVGNDVTARIHGTNMTNMADNGLYAGSGEYDLFDVTMDGVEEPIVASNFGTGGALVRWNGGRIANSLNPLGVQDAVGLEIRNVDIDYSTGTTTKVFRTRATSTSTGYIRVFNCEIRAKTAECIFDFSVGTLGYFILKGCRVELIFDADNPGGGSWRYMNWTTGNRFEIEDNTIILSKVGAAAIPSVDRHWILPTVTDYSTWLNNTIINLSGNTSAHVRTNQIDQNLIFFDRLHVQSNADARAFGVIGSTLNRRDFWSQGVPTAGTYKIGDVCWILQPAAGTPVGYACTASGTPGTWKAFGTLAA